MFNINIGVINEALEALGDVKVRFNPNTNEMRVKKGDQTINIELSEDENARKLQFIEMAGELNG